MTQLIEQNQLKEFDMDPTMAKAGIGVRKRVTEFDEELSSALFRKKQLFTQKRPSNYLNLDYFNQEIGRKRNSIKQVDMLI